MFFLITHSELYEAENKEFDGLKNIGRSHFVIQ